MLPHGFVATGINLNRFWATLLTSVDQVGSMLLWPANGPLKVLALLQAALSNTEKSPFSMACVGTVSNCGVADLTIVSWKPAKKNNLLRMMGPPRVPPNWFRFK